ncbi:hypothetical protein LCGC14_2959710 [marine sediment metagenome]|uniref:Uncharacterized protein n=1 Tax=marine sediment metagenome TaxID=412755 RepID=A0A0F8Y029_9ZZZZ
MELHIGYFIAGVISGFIMFQLTLYFVKRWIRKQKK